MPASMLVSMPVHYRFVEDREPDAGMTVEEPFKMLEKFFADGRAKLTGMPSEVRIVEKDTAVMMKSEMSCMNVYDTLMPGDYERHPAAFRSRLGENLSAVRQ